MRTSFPPRGGEWIAQLAAAAIGALAILAAAAMLFVGPGHTRWTPDGAPGSRQAPASPESQADPAHRRQAEPCTQAPPSGASTIKRYCERGGESR